MQRLSRLGPNALEDRSTESETPWTNRSSRRSGLTTGSLRD
jgi:hypothetical protein